MANPEHVALLKQGVEVWNAYRKKHNEFRPDLSEASLSSIDLIGAQLHQANLYEADLAGTDLRGVDFREADLNDAKLDGALLRGAYLVRANLRGASFTEADLRGAQLAGVKLRRASLRGANLSGGANLHNAELRDVDLSWTNFSGADLSGADLRGAILRGTILAAVDLTGAKGLEDVVHDGPSSIGVDTLYITRGGPPEAFLRGAGVTDHFIAYLASLTRQPVEFYSCFISHSTEDQLFADRLHADLQAQGVRCWFAPHDMKSGRKVHEQIDEAIRLHDKLLLILSPASMGSQWVKTEIGNARRRQIREGKRVLFPVSLVAFEAIRDWECFDADCGNDSAREIREYFIPDFSNWKDNDSYQAAFQRLLRDLKAAEHPAGVTGARS